MFSCLLDWHCVGTERFCKVLIVAFGPEIRASFHALIACVETCDYHLLQTPEVVV